ncbi:MAG: hypothetical protein ACXVY3_04980 [Gaiellaceae bacterium]
MPYAPFVAAIVVAAIVVGLVLRSRRPSAPRPSTSRILVPFTGGGLEPQVLNAAIRIARVEEATLVPAYLIVTPFEFALDAAMQRQMAVAMPLLEAVEHASLRAGIPVDARVESGRTPTHALQRLWGAERFDRIVAPAPAKRGPGFSEKDLAWLLTHAPSETLILKPQPPDGASGSDDRSASATS